MLSRDGEFALTHSSKDSGFCGFHKAQKMTFREKSSLSFADNLCFGAKVVAFCCEIIIPR